MDNLRVHDERCARLLRMYHLFVSGRWRLPSLFDPDWYRACYPETAGGVGGPAFHWLRHGRHEGRLPCALPAHELEIRLRAGQPEAGEALERMAGETLAPKHATKGRRANAIWARLALARAAASTDDWGLAAERLGGLDPERDLICGLGLPEQVFFWVEVLARNGDLAQAGRGLMKARRAFGNLPAGHLMAALLLSRATPGWEQGWHEALAPLYRQKRIAVPLVDGAGPSPAFDRLSAHPGKERAEGPLVSVIVPARDAGRTIDTALRSLASQGWRSLEVLVIDNGSRDDTPERARAWAARDPRFRLIDGKAEPGAYGARNLGLALAKGRFITMQDADDWSHPDRIARQVETLLRSPERPACMSFWSRMTEDLKVTGIRADVSLIHSNMSSLMIRPEVVRQIGYFDRVRFAADSEYLERLGAAFGAGSVLGVLPDLPLAFGRVRPGSLTGADDTGLFGQGGRDRRDYLAAARAWREGMSEPYLPRRPERRPFPVPAALERVPGQEG